MMDALAYEKTAAVLDDFKPENGWSPLQPFAHEPGKESQAFPFHGLGEILGEAASAIAQDVQAPDALAGGSVLAAASLASSPLANVLLPHGQRSPLSLFIVTGAASGDRKSATDEVACYAINECRKQQARDHLQAVQKWQGESQERRRNEPETKAPAPKVLTTSNATIEGIARLLKCQSTVGVFSAEGGEMLGGHSLRDERRMSGMSFYLKAWSAETLDSLRGGEGLSVLLGRRICLHVLVQPVILSNLLADPLAQGQGLLARCLIAQPETLAGSRLYRDCDPLANAAVIRFNKRIESLLLREPLCWDGGDGYELKPHDLPMAPEARAMWIAFYNQVELEQSSTGELAAARPFASKAAEQAARIAGVISMIEGRDQIGMKEMEGGIEVAAFYMGEHLRLTGAGRTELRTKQLVTLLDWLSIRGPIVSQASILQSVTRAVRGLKAAGIEGLLSELADRAYIRKAGGSAWEVRNVQS